MRSIRSLCRQTVPAPYANGKQLFECFSIPSSQPTFTIKRQRIDPEPLLDLILEKIVLSK